MEAVAIGLGLGAIVGLVLALTGAGGGILAVPLLVFAMHLPLAQAAPVGLIAVGLASALGAVLGLRQGIVRYRAAALVGIAGMLLAPVGVRLATLVPNGPLTIVFGLVLGFVALRTVRASSAPGSVAGTPRKAPPCELDPRSGRLAWTLPCGRALAATGVVSGLLSGLLGVGGGFVIVPSLTRFTALDARSIAATSLAVIAIVSTAGAGAAAITGMVSWDLAAPFSAGASVALLLARQVAARLDAKRLQQAFAATATVVAVLMVGKGLGWLDFAA